MSEREYMKQKVKIMKTERRGDANEINKNGCVKNKGKKLLNN